MTVLEHVLVALLQLLTARYAHEAAHVIDVTEGAHHQLVGREGLEASATFSAVVPETHGR